MTPEWALGALVIAAASFVMGLAGFGIGLVALAFLPFLMSPVTAVVLTMLPDMLQFAGDFRMVLYGVIVLAIAVTFPRGIDGIWTTISHRRRHASTPVARASGP